MTKTQLINGRHGACKALATAKMMANYKNIPQELKSLSNWVCWVGDKVPRDANNGGYARTNDPSTWAPFEIAIRAIDKYGFDGIGFVICPPYVGIDLDNCIDNNQLISDFVSCTQSYAEYSKSGKGLHIICKGTLPQGTRKSQFVEMYDGGRYLITTGDIYGGAKEVKECVGAINYLYRKYLEPKNAPVLPLHKAAYNPNSLDDRAIIEKACNSKTGHNFAALWAGDWQRLGYKSQNSADQALANQLAFYCGHDPDRIDNLFRCSGLYRPKWNEKRGAITYGQKTIEKALNGVSIAYSGDPAEKVR